MQKEKSGYIPLSLCRECGGHATFPLINLCLRCSERLARRIRRWRIIYGLEDAK